MDLQWAGRVAVGQLSGWPWGAWDLQPWTCVGDPREKVGLYLGRLSATLGPVCSVQRAVGVGVELRRRKEEGNHVS